MSHARYYTFMSIARRQVVLRAALARRQGAFFSAEYARIRGVVRFVASLRQGHSVHLFELFTAPAKRGAVVRCEAWV